MNRYVVVVFPDESKAFEGLHALEQLHAEGHLTAYGTVILERDDKGAVSIKRRTDDRGLGFSVGALTGGLIGMLAGPAGVAIGLGAGGVAGAWRDYLHVEVTDEFLEAVEKELTPGKFALVAEVVEDWVAPINTRMDALGGKVVREARQDFIDDLIERRVAAGRAEIEERKTERAGAKAERMESDLEAELQNAQERLRRTADKAHQRLEATKEEMSAKLHTLEEQANQAKPDIKGRIEQRIAGLRKDFEEREKKLRRAYDLTQEALQP
jgi:uncharacterized membrane protein